MKKLALVSVLLALVTFTGFAAVTDDLALNASVAQVLSLDIPAADLSITPTTGSNTTITLRSNIKGGVTISAAATYGELVWGGLTDWALGDKDETEYIDYTVQLKLGETAVATAINLANTTSGELGDINSKIKGTGNAGVDYTLVITPDGVADSGAGLASGVYRDIITLTIAAQ